MMRLMLVGLWSLFFLTPVQAMTESTVADQSSVEVTVYNNNLGLVKDRRKIALSTGEGELRFMDVAAYIQPESVHIKELNRPHKFMVLEQNYEYDLISYEKILEKNVGQSIKLNYRSPQTDRVTEVDAQLLSYNNGQAVYKIDGAIHLGHPGTPIIPKIPDNLISKPTLMWMYDNQAGRNLDVEVSYLTESIAWQADYVLVVDKADKMGELSGWVSIDNQTGTTYNDAKLKVVAGDINRVQTIDYEGQMLAGALNADIRPRKSGFEEQEFFEYHIYDLARPTTIKNNQKKQLNLLDVQGVRLTKTYELIGQPFYYFRQYDSSNVPKWPINVWMSFKNSKDNNMGMPLPEGVVRLYKKDHTNSLQFIGEDRIEHTPKNETVRLNIGDAFDIVAERKQTDYKVLARNMYESEWEVELRNRKDEDIVVDVIEPAQGDWQIVSSNYQHVKMDVHRFKFAVNIKANDKAVLKYRIKVTR